MTSQNSGNSRSIDSSARILYLQRLVSHRRVLLVGGDFALAQFIAESRAKNITAVLEQIPTSPWSGSEAELSPDSQIKLQIMPYDDLIFRDGAFDTVVFPDLAKLTDPTAALNEAKRVTGTRGHVVIAFGNSTCDYYQTYDLLASIFPSVQMVGQSPFIGYAVADLSFDDPDLQVSFDTSLLGGETEEIECFLAVCGDREAELEPYSIIQIPRAETYAGETDEEDLNDARIEIKSLNDELSQLLTENKSLKEQVEQAKLETGNRGVRIASLEKDLEAELKQSETARARAVQLAKELDDERRAAQKKKLEDEYSRRTGDMELQTRLREVSAELRQVQERAKSAEKARDELVDRMRGDAAEIDRLRQKNDGLEKDSETLKNSIAAEREILEKENLRLEAALREKAAKLSEVSGAIKQRDSIIRDLVVEVEAKGQTILKLAEKNERMEIEAAALKGARAGQYRARVEAELALAALEMEIRRMKSDSIETRAFLDGRKKDGGRPQAEADSVTQDFARAQNRVAKLEGELQAARWRITEVETRGQDALGRVRELEAGIASLERGSRMMEGECERYKSRSLELEDDLEKERKRVEELHDEVSAAASRQTRLENELAGLTERSIEAQKALDETRLRAEAAELRAKQAESRMKANAIELEGTREQIASVSRSAKTIEAELRREIAKDLEQASRVSSEAGGLDEQLKQARSRIEEQQACNEDLARELGMLKAGLAEESDRTRKAGADAARLAGEKGNLENKVSKLEQELAERISELASNEQVISSLREEMSNLSEKVRHLRAAQTRVP